MSQPLPNPYEHELPAEQLALGRAGAWFATVLFLLLIAVPSIWQEIKELSRDQGWIPAVEFSRAVRGVDQPNVEIAQRLRSYERNLESHLEWAKPMRQWAQRQQSQWVGAGNHKVVLGRDGWLFYRPEINALTGYGPLRIEPKSVAADPVTGDWQPPVDAVVDFAAELKARGIELWMVPVPMKESIYPEMLGAPSSGPLSHPDQAALYRKYRANGIKVIELDQFLWSLKAGDKTDGPVYLKTDTHWSPRGMQAVAGLLAEQLVAHGNLDLTLEKQSTDLLQFSGTGDLMQKLDIDSMQRGENLTVRKTLSEPPAGMPSITLLGDSFVNIFRDPGLGFGVGAQVSDQQANPKRRWLGSKAGLGEQLMTMLSAPVEIIAINGGGASQVRERFAAKPASELAQRKIVIWVLAARDLFLGRAESIANQVAWQKVKFAASGVKTNELTTEFTEAKIAATVLEVAPIPADLDPQLTNYPSSIVAVKYRVDEVKEGKLSEKEIVVYQWLFRKRIWQPAAKLKVGQQVELHLLPWSDEREAYSVNLFDAFPESEHFWAE